MLVRRVGTTMTVFGVALTVMVFVSILAMVQGIQSVFVDTGDPLNLLIIRKGSQSETNSFFDRNIKGIIDTMDGVTAVAGEIIILLNRSAPAVAQQILLPVEFPRNRWNCGRQIGRAHV